MSSFNGEIDILDAVAYMTTARGMLIKVDECDLAKVAEYNWQAVKKGLTYVARTEVWVSGVRYNLHLHNLLMDVPKGLEIDHINRDALDNRRSNLRLANRNQQNLNRQLRGSSGYYGVSERSSCTMNPYIARVGHIGFPETCFDNPEDAARYRDECMVSYYSGLDADSNLPESYLDFINFNFPIKELLL